MKKLFVFLTLIALAACAPAPTPAPTAAPPTAAPKATVAATQAPAATQPPAATATTAATTAPAVTAAPKAATNTPAPTATTVPPGVTAAPGALRVQFWSYLTGATQVVAVQKAADKFNAANPQYFIVPVVAGNITETSRKMNAAIQANAVPDMVMGNPGDLADYDTAGVMFDMASLISDARDGLSAAQLAEINQPLFFDRWNNKTIGVSFGRSAQVMYYNVDMLKAAGFDKAPATWDDFDKVCAAVTKGDVACYAFASSTSTFAGWVWSRGGKYASDDEKKAVFDEQAGIDTLKWLKNLVDKKYAYVPAAAFGDQTDFGNSKTAFTFGSTAGLPFYQIAVKGSAKPFAWDIAPMPAGPGGKQNVDLFGPSVGIVKSTPEKQRAAWLFLKYMLSTDQEVDWAVQTAYFPAVKSAIDKLVAMTPDQAKAANPAFAEYLTQYKTAVGYSSSLGRREPVAPAWQGVRGTIQNMLTAVFLNKSGADFTNTDPEKAAKEGVERVNKQLSEFGK